VPLPESALAFLGRAAAVRLTVFDRDSEGLAGLRNAGTAARSDRARPAPAARPQPRGNGLSRAIRRVIGRR